MAGVVEMTRKYGRPDLERLGLFIEMPYMNGKGYVSPYALPKTVKGQGFRCVGPKSKSATQDGYFEKQFNRIFEGETIKKRKKKEFEGKRKALFKYPGSSKKHASPGDYYGTFSGPITAFSRETRKIKSLKIHKKNFLCNPGKKGGYGYVNISLSKYPEHISSQPHLISKPRKSKFCQGPMHNVHYPQPYFDTNPYAEDNFNRLPIYVRPNDQEGTKLQNAEVWKPSSPAKWPGGCKSGTINPYPEYMSRLTKKNDNIKKKTTKTEPFKIHSLSFKTMYSCSIIDRNVDISCNRQNFKNYKPQYTKRLLIPV